jgi:hypothetical protein
MFHKHADNYNVKIWDDKGDKHLLHANQVHDFDLHHWQGWHCDAGFNYIYIHENGDVWSGMCENTYLGTLGSDAALLPQPDICKKPTCTNCTTDLAVRKTPPMSAIGK